MTACTSPRKAWINPLGGPFIFDPAWPGPRGAEVSQRCGRCLACRISYGELWALRYEHELLAWDGVASFLTLTYRPDLRPKSYTEWQHYIRAFRKNVVREFGTYRAPGCAERGDQGGAPHQHVIHYGQAYPDREPVSKSRSGRVLYRSATLERLWPYGYAVIGDVTPESIRYVCRYSTKKMTGHVGIGEMHDGLRMYRDENGVLDPLPVAFPIHVQRPSLGANFVADFGAQLESGIFGRGGVVQPTPRQYVREVAKVDPDRAERLLLKRAEAAAAARDVREESLQRCEVRDEVLRARLGRKLERV